MKMVTCQNCGRIILSGAQIYIAGDKGQVGPMCGKCANKYASKICAALKDHPTSKERRAAKRAEHEQAGQAGQAEQVVQ